jgi:hypothetical protein
MRRRGSCVDIVVGRALPACVLPDRDGCWGRPSKVRCSDEVALEDRTSERMTMSNFTQRTSSGQSNIDIQMNS